ncbi:nucleolar protein 8 isoform X1 [Prionailurus bengalensis]|uniref:nucleolar protein 8 isoform X1 n=1 Tax=Prionailurus bengalensis TaxID=37029 RepID=UPI001CA84A66|nr:nucleolar protein 8 isoform X1 [Prionailurus bengalensis]XP_043421705.1 nucleolar protein 8 isoform X1 [Prionailurus bengalensis]
MKANREVKRLFVGGLGQNISRADLQNQFSRFGEVSDVEIITRKDDKGNPQKVFAYINIRLAEADLNKCMSVLNKTKWKGGTLQIQLAKESFLHRLAQEREEAKAKKEKSTIGNTSFLEKMGVVDFHVKAVPGTEVPGHKNWVVSKFGRVLPVLHLKNQHKRKIMKYDPSKYCHNLKKIGDDVTDVTPVSHLTWELEGGDDPMSKKRRGEFFAAHSPPRKRIKVQKDEACAAFPAARARPSRVPGSLQPLQQEVAQETPCDPVTPPLLRVPASHSQKLKNVFVQTSGTGTTRNRNHMSDDDTHSEEEIRLLITREESLEKTMRSSIDESANEPFDVVRGDFKPDVRKLRSLPGLGDASCLAGEDHVIGSDCNYDSGDTDEIIATRKKPSEVKSSTEFSQMGTSVHKKALKNRKNCELSDHSVEAQNRKTNAELAVSPGATSHSNSCEDVGSVSECSGSEEDEEYNALMRNCRRVSLTLTDLEQLAGSDLQAPGHDPESGDQETPAKCDEASKSHRTRGGLHRRQQCIHPAEIVAALLEGEENTHGKQKPKENSLKPKFQAFKGVRCLYGKESVKKTLKDRVASDDTNKDQRSLKHDPSGLSTGKGSPCANDSPSELTPLQHAKKASDPNQMQPEKRQSTFESKDRKMVSPSNSERGSRSPTSSLLPLKDEKSLSLGIKTPRISFDKDGYHGTRKTREGSGRSSHMAPEKALEGSSRRAAQGSSTDSPLPVTAWSGLPAKGKHTDDNEKRLAALEERQKAKEVRKQLVHNALADLDGHPEDKPTHIIFGSDSDTEETPTREQSHPGEEPVKESVSRASGKLFDSEDEESDSEDDSHRFRIKPQFEGRAGRKLMDLQSHFGTDDRFRMDSRFLESDSEEEREEENDSRTAEEEELAAEKLKTLDVVQSVLQTTLSDSTHKGSVAAKKFKDVIRYDPTRHDHATYERKTDDKPKESKAKRRKKREEAEKLPEVSKEMYYNIAADLKEIFQTTKVTSETADDTPSTENPDGEKVEVHEPAPLTAGAWQPGGFTFSFFDSDAKDVKEDAYRVETVRTGKVVWQGAPRFQDSSSEEEDVTEETDDRKPSPREVSVPEKETTRFFFFSKNDERLHSSHLFWRGVGSNISRNSWEARTNNLRMDCRKKHKDAKRRVKPK